MKERLFKFKRFSVAHEASAMKVGIDGVLTGLWTDVPAEGRVLDAGSGCGVISLIIAQRSERLRICAVEKDLGAADEAAVNFERSPWRERLEAQCADWLEYARRKAPFNLIVSNPPFYDDGVDAGDDLRLSARHVGSLGPLSLLNHASELLTYDGEIAMIFPTEYVDKLIFEGENLSLYIRRLAYVSHHRGTEEKRVLAQWSKLKTRCEVSHLVLFEDDKVTPTAEYHDLGKDFYLKF